MNPSPLWVERLLDQDWTPERSIQIDRWLNYVEQEFTSKDSLHTGDYDIFAALIRSVVGHPKPVIKALLKAIAISNGQPLALVERLFQEHGGAL